MQVGNMHYRSEEDLPNEARLFPLSGAFLLPGSVLPLNIFEPRYLELFDDALAGDRLVAVVQTNYVTEDAKPVDDLCNVGTLGRIISLAESGDGRYVVSVAGICRFRIKEEKAVKKPYRVAKICPFVKDLAEPSSEADEYRPQLLAHFMTYIESNDIEIDTDDYKQLRVPDLVNILSSLVPFDIAEKQALLEADYKTRVETLVALLDMGYSSDDDETPQTVQ
ncbi:MULTISPECIES: LON peptidase substrate-binding domain-containing protein [unclassified Lentilitoribacter]|jgi:Lon protease-like protein|uniref:LON peptidase substrate-binding domain-containing protein n=1 Tax=unclassified Lentilitoribacter TaxID=2647570 RepID=UPI0013A69686|nr:LON peptidase substrate-binding domain-containing protein [Lentilitoribacter sp. Alg239-R112]